MPESKKIYIKTEPGGKVLFGRLSDLDAAKLEEAVQNTEMPEELLDLRYNPDGDFRECEGVFNVGNEGEIGNEGIISYDPEGPIEIPKNDAGAFEDGAYLVYLSLSKVSVEFEFTPEEGEYSADYFVEQSVPIKLPDCVEHQRYGVPNYNVIIDFKYDGESVDPYSDGIEDRGWEDFICFMVVKDGKVSLVYKNCDGKEEWTNT